MNEWKTAIETPLRSVDGQTLAESRPYTPQLRPTFPLLTIIDDRSNDEGEIIRIRKDTFSIGRCEGDLVIPGEAMLSAKHAQLSLKQINDDRWAWVLEDQKSRHGIFLRLTEFDLQPGNEFVVGGTKLRMHGSDCISKFGAPPSQPYDPYFADKSTVKSRSAVEVCAYSVIHPETEIQLSSKGLRIGRLTSGTSSLSTDPFLEAYHASLDRAGDGMWHIKDRKSLNGTWLRVNRVVMTTPTFFLLGEQRFRFMQT